MTDRPAAAGTGAAPLLSIRGLSKSYGEHAALDTIDLDVARGEFVALLGPSGCGKTTLLKIIAGLLSATKGTLTIGGETMNDIAAYKRPVNTVFQNYALFPHLTVYDNVAFGPRRHRRSKSEIQTDVAAALQLVGMSAFAERFPAQLSGGQQQRIALARAVVNKPSVLLLDEPLAALDLQLRKRMQLELKTLQRHLAMTFIFVTHDQDEALTMADKIVVMHDGRIQQIGIGEDIYRRPANRFVAGFIGDANFIDPSVDTIEGAFAASASPSRTQLMVRLEDIVVSPQQPAWQDFQFIRCTLTQRIFKGSSISFVCRTARGTEIIAVPKVIPGIAAGEQIVLSWRADAARQLTD